MHRSKWHCYSITSSARSDAQSTYSFRAATVRNILDRFRASLAQYAALLRPTVSSMAQDSAGLDGNAEAEQRQDE